MVTCLTGEFVSFSIWLLSMIKVYIRHCSDVCTYCKLLIGFHDRNQASEIKYKTFCSHFHIISRTCLSGTEQLI